MLPPNFATSDWPAVTISESPVADGDRGSTWNYGSNFGGPTRSGWTSGADTIRSGSTEGMFGTWGVVDSGYNGGTTTIAGYTFVNSKISMCAGTAGAVCRG